MRPISAYSTALLLSSLALSACALMPNPLNQPLNRSNNPTLNAQSRSVRSVLRPDVLQMPSPNHNERPANAKINTIVLHHTAMAGDARAVARFFANPKAGASSHYIVDRDGSLVQPVADDRRSWHAGKSEFNGVGDVNNFSIGIEICNVGDSQEPYSDAQYDGIIRLVGWLVQTYQVPLNQITRHRDVAVPKGRKIDTSNNFSVERVVTGVRALLNGSYVPPAVQPPTPPPALPAYRNVLVESGQKTFEDLADIHLDNSNRWVEIQALNPGVTGLKPGQMVKIPNHAEMFSQLAR
ncbi:MAG: N-acetylmuramoyl-L-alanine amidase [Cypionkella sp.]